jgi:hypothetical protein
MRAGRTGAEIASNMAPRPNFPNRPDNRIE